MANGVLPHWVEPAGETVEECVERLRSQGWRPRQKVLLNPWHLIRMLGLPSEWQPMYVGAQSDPNGLVLVVESPDFELMPPDCESPTVHHEWQRQVMTDDDGKVWIRAQLLEDRPLETDRVEKVAFELFRVHVLAEDDWEGPVTHANWETLTSSGEKEQWRESARRALEAIDGH